MSSSVKTDWNCLFSASALDLLSSMKHPSTSKVATPLLSCFLDLMYLQNFFVILVLACCSSVMSSPMLRISAMYFLCSHSIVFLMAFLVALNFAQSSGLSDVLALLYCLCLAHIDLLILLFINKEHIQIDYQQHTKI